MGTGPRNSSRGTPRGAQRLIQRAVVAASAVVLLAAAGAHAAPGDGARAGGTTIETATDLAPFDGRVTTLTPAERKAMTGPVWRKGCPVGLADLRAIRAPHVGFDGEAHDGILIVHRRYAAGALRALARLYDAGFPIRRIVPIERYGGSDHRSIEADNTSAFNCRKVTGGSGWSEHAYGRAIDLNPIENPYVTRSGTTSHVKSRTYLNRNNVRPGMLTDGSLGVRTFAAQGWRWGGHWRGIKDYQHLSPTGR